MSEERLGRNPQPALKAERLSEAEKGQVWHRGLSLFSFHFFRKQCLLSPCKEQP